METQDSPGSHPPISRLLVVDDDPDGRRGLLNLVVPSGNTVDVP
jgi:hypothetical protein